MVYVKYIAEESNHFHAQAAVAASAGALLGYLKPSWFGSVQQAATIAAITSLAGGAAYTATYTLGYACQLDAKNRESLADIAFVFVGLISPKATSLLGYGTTWTQALTLSLPGLAAGRIWKNGPNADIGMYDRIPPIVWVGAIIGLIQPGNGWFDPIETARLVGAISMTDLLLSHVSNSRVEKNESLLETRRKRSDAPSLDRAVLGMALLAALTGKFYPSKLRPLFLTAGIFYGQQYVHEKVKSSAIPK